MKKLLTIISISSVLALGACNGHSRDEGEYTTGASIDSMINEATSAVSNTADSTAAKMDSTAKAAADTIKAAVDSATRR